MDAAAARKSRLAERAFYFGLYIETIRGQRKGNTADLIDRIEALDREILADASREVSLAELLMSEKPFHVPGMQRRVDAGRVTIDTRALGQSSAAGGGNLVPIDFVSEMREFLATRSSIYQLDVTVLPIPGKRRIEIPSRTTSGTAVLTGEGTAFPASDPTFGKTTLGAYKYGKLMEITTELTQDIGVPLDAMIARQAGMSFELGYGPRFASDVAHTNGPQGLFNSVAIGATAHTGGTGVPSYTDFNNLLYSVPAQYRTIDSQWLLPANSIPQIREVVDVGGYPIFQPATITGESDRLLGYPVVTRTFRRSAPRLAPRSRSAPGPGITYATRASTSKGRSKPSSTLTWSYTRRYTPSTAHGSTTPASVRCCRQHHDGHPRHVWRPARLLRAARVRRR